MDGIFGGYLRAGLMASAAIVCVATAAPAMAQTRTFNVPEQRAESGVSAFGRQADIQILISSRDARDRRTNEVRGNFTVQEGLARLLAGTGLRARATGAQTFSVVRAVPGEAEAGDAAADSERVRLGDRPDVLVVGSRLGTRSPAEATMPVRVITREEIDRSGAGSIAEALSYMSEVSVNNAGDTYIGATTGVGATGNPIDATTVQLRGLPAGTTLILINGRRAGESAAFQSSGQFDLSTIPLAMVERIEVLPYGASAIYGGDALAGVVNIVLRRGASGFEIRGRHSIADGYSESEASILWGKSWSGGQITVGANWRRTGRLTSFERDITANEDFTRFGGYDFRSPFAAFPGNVYSLAGCPAPPNFCFVPIAQRGNLPGLNSPFAGVPTGQNGQNLGPADFAQTAGRLNTASTLYNLFSPGQTWGVNASGSINVTDNVELFAEFAFSRRTIPASEVSLYLQGGTYQIAAATVAAGNPYNPFGVDVGVDFSVANTGVFKDYSNDHWRALLGARGNVGRWTWEVTAVESRDSGTITRGNGAFDLDAVAAALQSTDPATALNPFVGDDSAPWSEQLLQSLLLPDQVVHFTSQLRDITAIVRGPLLHLPAGDVLVVAGGEYQRNSLRDDTSLANGGSDSSWATFAEMRVPIWKREGDSRERLAATAAWRRETSNRYEGGANTWTLGLEFRPVQTLLLRGSYSTAFKPVVAFTALRPSTEFASGAVDPRFGQFVFFDFLSGGGIPDGLRPETGTSRTLGVTWSPSSRFRGSVTWWDNRLRNRLSYPSPALLLANEDAFPGRVIRDPNTGMIQLMDIRQINIARTDVSGVDVALDGRLTTGIGDFIPSISATYVIRHREQLLPTSPVQNNLGIYRLTGWSPRWKIVPRLGWDYRGIVYTNIAGRYVSAYTDPEPLAVGPRAGTLQRLGNFILVDLNVELNIGRWLVPHSSLLSGTRLSLGVNNLFDKGPEFCNACAGYDGSQYDILGRRFNLGLRLSF